MLKRFIAVRAGNFPRGSLSKIQLAPKGRQEEHCSEVTPLKAPALVAVAVSLLAIWSYLFLTSAQCTESLNLTQPPEKFHEISDTAFKNYWTEKQLHPVNPFDAYLLRRSGIKSGRYFFDYGTDWALGGGYFVYRVTVSADGKVEVEGTSMDKFWMH